MDAATITDIVRSVITAELHHLQPQNPQQAPRRPGRPPSLHTRSSERSITFSIESHVRIIENNRLQNGVVISMTPTGWAEVKLTGGITVSRRTLQLLQVTDSTSPPIEPTSDITAVAPVAPSRPSSTFSWLYVPLISLAESLKTGQSPRPTCFSANHAKELIGLQLFTECASLLSQHLTLPVTWQGPYIAPEVQEQIITPINDNSSFQEMLHKASAATRPTSTSPTPAPTSRRRPREPASTTTSVTSSAVTYVEGEDL